MEKELLSIVETLENFRGILIGSRIVIHSDHKHLSFDSFKSERIRRWRLLLEEYDYFFTYTPGKDDFIAGMLSRYPFHSSTPSELRKICAEPEINTVDNDHDNPCPVDFKYISTEQAKDIKIQLHRNSPGYSTKTIHEVDLIFLMIK